MKEYELCVIGAGPVGIYTSYYGGLKGMKTIMIESLEEIGGQLSALYPEKYIYDTPSIPKIKAIDLVKNLETQMLEYKENIEVRTSTIAKNVKKLETGDFIIETNDDTFKSKTVIICVGKGAYEPRKLGLPGEDDFNNIEYSIKNLSKYKNKKIAIFGGGDSAVDWANMLLAKGNDVVLIHRRDEFRAHDENIKKFETSGGVVHKSFVAKELKGKDSISSIVIESKKDSNETKELEVDDVLVFFGISSSFGPVMDWDIELEKKSILVERNQKTSVEGIYACGDACTYDGKIKTITSGYGEAIHAVSAAYKLIHGKVGSIFSSTRKK